MRLAIVGLPARLIGFIKRLSMSFMGRIHWRPFAFFFCSMAVELCVGLLSIGRLFIFKSISIQSIQSTPLLTNCCLSWTVFPNSFQAEAIKLLSDFSEMKIILAILDYVSLSFSLSLLCLYKAPSKLQPTSIHRPRY